MYAHLIHSPVSGPYSSLLRPAGCLSEMTRSSQRIVWWPRRTDTKTSVLVSDRHCVVYNYVYYEYRVHILSYTVFLLYFCDNILSNPDSTNYLHIAGQSASNAANYINATMIAVSGHTHTDTHMHTHTHTQARTHTNTHTHTRTHTYIQTAPLLCRATQNVVGM